MLKVHCDRLGKEVLIWASSIVGMSNTDNGIVVSYQCACGDMAQLLTGATAPVQASAHVAA